MKKIYTFLFLAAVFTITTSSIITSGTVHTNSLMEPTGIADKTGNPAYANTCTECHTGATVNSGGGSVTINVKDGNGAAITAYEFNQTYTVDVVVAQASISKYGFDAEIVTSSNTNAGTLTAGTGSKLLQGSKSTNITHSAVATATPAGSRTFTFTWKTPGSDVGAVTIYAAGLAANGNGTQSGDKVYNSSKKLNAVSGINEFQKAVTGLSVYPNPVNTLVNVSYSLVKAANVNISLHSVNGQKIADLLQAKQAEGLQKTAINLPSSISNGIYLLQISADGNSTFQKILVNK